MSRSFRGIRADALALPILERRNLLVAIMESFDREKPPEWERAWRDSVAERVAAFDAEQMPAPP